MFEGRYPGSVAAQVEALHDALYNADPSPRTAPPVLRLGRLVADLDFRRRTVENLPQTLVRVQEELAEVETEVADRCFAGLGDTIMTTTVGA